MIIMVHSTIFFSKQTLEMNYSLSSGVKRDCTLDVCSRPTWWIVFCRLLINDVQNTDIPKILERARPRILLRLKVFDFTSLQHCCLMTQICFSTILTYCRVRVGSGFKTYILRALQKNYAHRGSFHIIHSHYGKPGKAMLSAKC